MNDKPYSNMVGYIDDSQIIEYVKQYRNIWDRTDPKFGIPKETERSWQAIANAFDCEVDECKSRWTIIRSRYAKECRDIRNNFLESKPYKVSWPFYEQCSFLKNVIRPRRSRKSLLTSRNVSTCYDEIYQTKMEPEDPQPSEEIDINDRHMSPSFLDVNIETSSSMSEPVSQDSKRKKNNDDLKQDVINIITSSHSDLKEYLKNCQSTSAVPEGISPEDWHCVLSIGISLSKMKDTKKKMILKAKLMNILAEEWSD